MDGSWLALSAVGLLGLASARRGSAMFQLWSRNEWSAKDFPAFVVFTRQQGMRMAEPVPSWITANEWVRERLTDKGRYGTRPTTARKVPRNVESLATPEWLLPDGSLAEDITLKRSLGGLTLAYREFRWSVSKMPEHVQRRLRTIMLGRKNKQRAINLLTDELCALKTPGEDDDPSDIARDWLITEIIWLMNTTNIG